MRNLHWLQVNKTFKEAWKEKKKEKLPFNSLRMFQRICLLPSKVKREKRNSEEFIPSWNFC